MPPVPGQTPGTDPRKEVSTIVRKWTMSACVVLAWSLLALMAAAGMRGPNHPVAQANTSTATSISTASSSTPLTLVSESMTARPAIVTPGPARHRVTAAPAPHPATWIVRPGDTLSAIAAALGVPGGWQALYAANRPAIGPDPGVIYAGTVLTVPGQRQPARYAVAPGDTLSAIAATLGVPGGWQALYAANRQVIGADPDVIHAGTVLTAPRLTAPAGAGPAAHRKARPAASAPARHPHASTTAPAPAGPSPQAPAASRAAGYPAATAHPTEPGHVTAPAGGMPRWLEDVLLAAGVLAATAFAAEPAAALARRRRHVGHPAPHRVPALGTARNAQGAVPGPVRPANGGHAAERTRIVLAEHERLIVTYCARDHAVYVLAPPGEDPRAVLGAARLVLSEDTYEDLAGHLGVPAAWPLE
jgi:LysM repeat protein